MITIIHDEQSSSLIKLIEQASERALATVPQLLDADDLLIDFVVVDEDEITRLNKAAFDKDYATDVLSFPSLNSDLPYTRSNYPFDFDEANNALMLGQVVLCEAVAKRQAQELSHSYLNEAVYLFVHSLLHLVGYEHQDEQDKAQMRALEKQIMSDDFREYIEGVAL